MLKKNYSIIMIVLLALVLIFFVLWYFEKRINRVDDKMKKTSLGNSKYESRFSANSN